MVEPVHRADGGENAAGGRAALVFDHRVRARVKRVEASKVLTEKKWLCVHDTPEGDLAGVLRNEAYVILCLDARAR